ncbi:NADPH-dependent glutamate synthase [Candidatus Woesearchaeota archaeon]|nr:NADPH-dependent glutamate synthase [Candidatus Woesearchaeota archaeon]
MDRVMMREHSPEKRIKDFREVALGFSEKEALEEAGRCLLCTKPSCVKGCPAKVDIPGFIRKLREKHYDRALDEIKKTNTLPAVCGRVCPAEFQCEKSCILSNKGAAIAVQALERFAADKGNTARCTGQKGKGSKVAVIGSGPAGVTCAADLALKGYDVTIFEALHAPGGVLIYGIPEFRLPNQVVREEIEMVSRLGVSIRLNQIVGLTVDMKDLLKDHEAVFVGVGAGLPRFLGIDGENLINVITANEFLTRVNLMKAYRFPEYATPAYKAKRTIVVGGGNVAMDAARCARRLGSEVVVVYRRGEEEMPAREVEIEHAKAEGIRFMLLTNPTKVLGDKKVEKVELQRMRLGEPDSSGRRRPEPIPGSEFLEGCDQFIIAIGTSPNPVLLKKLDVEKTNKGTIIVDEKQQTSDPRIFAGGDISSGEATVIQAIGDGKRAAEGVDDFLDSKK